MTQEVHGKLKPGLSLPQQHSTKTLFTSQLDLHLRKTLVKCYTWSTALYGAELGHCRRDSEDQLGRSCVKWRSITYGQWVEERPTNNKRKANWIGHILRSNCLLKHVIEGKIAGRKEVKRRPERWCKRLLDDIKEKTGYWKLEMEALDRILWRTDFGRVHGPLVSTDLSA